MSCRKLHRHLRRITGGTVRDALLATVPEDRRAGIEAFCGGLRAGGLGVPFRRWDGATVVGVRPERRRLHAVPPDDDR